MDLRKIIFPLHKWWWLIVLSTVVAAVASFLATRGQPIAYQARTTLMIGGTINDPNPSSSEFFLGEQLATAYADIANRDLVRQATMEALGIRRLPDYIARALPKTQILEIVVTDQDPRRAQTVADELAAQLIALSPTSLDPEEQSRLEFVNQQLDVIEARLDETEGQIESLKIQLGALDSAQEIKNTQDQISALQTVLNTLHNTYANLLASTNQEAINSLTVIEPAALPSRPIGTDQITTVLISAAVGLILAVSAAYLLEYILDTSLKFPEDIERIFQADIIGHFFKGSWLRRKKPPVLIINEPEHPSAEAYKILRTNLLFMDDTTESLKTVLIASPEKQKGTTDLGINLAHSLATGNKKIVLLDADLRLPTVHSQLGLSNEKGLGEVLTNQATLEEVIQSVPNSRVMVITAGTQPPDLVERLDSSKMEELLAKLKDKADMVIIEAPPFFVADTSILANKVDGILAVVRPGFSKKDDVKSMAEQIARAHARLVGIALNGIPSWGATYFAKIRNNRYVMS